MLKPVMDVVMVLCGFWYLLPLSEFNSPEGPYTLPMELGPQKNPSLLWFWGPNSIMVVYMGPSGFRHSPGLGFRVQTSSSPHLFCLCFAGNVLYVGPTTYLYAARVPATKLHGFRIKILALNPKPWTHGMFTPWAFAAAALHAFALFENGCA